MTIEPARQTNLVSMFLEQAGERAERPFLWRHDQAGWQARTWAECRHEVLDAARGLHGLGLRRGDRVLLVSENRPEWLLADLAIMAAGGVTVPAYVTNSVEAHRHILSNTRARFAIVSTSTLLRRVLAAAPPDVTSVVSFEPPEGVTSSGPALHRWESIRLTGRGSSFDVAAEAARLTRRDLACILHTSGTGGLPRGVMLSHGAILSNLEGARIVLSRIGLGEEVFLSFLPASHAYEHTAGQHLPIALGAQVRYVENAARITASLLEVRPTILIAVPRLFETMHRRMRAELERRGPLRRGLFRAAVQLGRRRVAGEDLRPLDRVVDRLLDPLVRDKVRARFGGRLKAIVSGGAPINPELVLFFHAVGLRLLPGYGLTEASPVVTVNPPLRVKHDTVGVPLAGVELRLAEDGEILVRGELVMDGYWNDPETSASVLRDGWLHTGDIGTLDGEGYLRITDRKRDFIKTTGGDMVAPAHIEGFLMLESAIAQAIVFGDARPHLVAILVPDQETLEAWGKEHGIDPSAESCATHPDFQRILRAAVDRANLRLAPAERVRRFHIAPDPFTIENDMLTPTLKLRRHRILERYRERIERLYDASGTGIDV